MKGLVAPATVLYLTEAIDSSLQLLPALQKKKKNGIIASPQNHQHQQGSDNSKQYSNTNKTPGELIPWLINSKLVSCLYGIIQTIRKHSDVLMDGSHVP